MSEEKKITINDIINELKRLQVEHGDIPCIKEEVQPPENAPYYLPAWPEYNEKENRIEF